MVDIRRLPPRPSKRLPNPKPELNPRAPGILFRPAIGHNPDNALLSAEDVVEKEVVVAVAHPGVVEVELFLGDGDHVP